MRGWTKIQVPLAEMNIETKTECIQIGVLVKKAILEGRETVPDYACLPEKEVQQIIKRNRTISEIARGLFPYEFGSWGKEVDRNNELYDIESHEEEAQDEEERRENHREMTKNKRRRSYGVKNKSDSDNSEDSESISMHYQKAAEPVNQPFMSNLTQQQTSMSSSPMMVSFIQQKPI